MKLIEIHKVFDKCPVPVLIIEGAWDLTWNTDKPEILHKNHPSSTLVMFEDAGHGVYDEAPEKFFATLKTFLATLPKVSAESVRS